MSEQAQHFAPIDKHRLDVEWENQPNLFKNYSDQWALAKRRWAEAQDELKVTFAEMASAIRKDPARFDLGKITDDSVKTAVQMTPDYQAAQRAVISAQFEAEVLEGAVFSLHQRKAALENLVELHSRNYFSSPRTPDQKDFSRARIAANQNETSAE